MDWELLISLPVTAVLTVWGWSKVHRNEMERDRAANHRELVSCPSNRCA